MTSRERIGNKRFWKRTEGMEGLDKRVSNIGLSHETSRLGCGTRMSDKLSV